MKKHIETTPRRKPGPSSARTAGRLPRPAVLLFDPPSESSLTALAVDALRAGVVVSTRTMKPP